jgi:nicotinamide-nucleotide amidase
MKKLISTLKKKSLTLALAESVTAGYASYLVTTVPGASAVFKGGLVAYSLDTKHKFFGMSPQHLKKTQGVSTDTALILAKKIRRLMKADIGGSVVGFAGPEAKKGVGVGTIHMAVATAKGNTLKKYIIKGSRDKVRKKAAALLISLINDRLLNI